MGTQALGSAAPTHPPTLHHRGFSCAFFEEGLLLLSFGEWFWQRHTLAHRSHLGVTDWTPR